MKSGLENLKPHIKWPSALFDHLEKSMERAFEEMTSDFRTPSNPDFTGSTENRLCRVDETPTYLLVSIEAKGLCRDDLKVNVSGDQLFVSSCTSKGKGFEKSFSLPRDIDGTKIYATFEDQDLIICLPKREKFAGEIPIQELRHS